MSKKTKTHWKDDSDISRCQKCLQKFSITRRKHHCRNCGGIYCWKCSANDMPLPHLKIEKPVRICDKCYNTTDQGRIARSPIPTDLFNAPQESSTPPPSSFDSSFDSSPTPTQDPLASHDDPYEFKIEDMGQNEPRFVVDTWGQDTGYGEEQEQEQEQAPSLDMDQTKRMLAMVNQAEEMGEHTLVMLDEQEQIIRNATDNVDIILDNTAKSKRHMRGIKSVRGALVNKVTKNPWKNQKNGKQPKNSRSKNNSAAQSTSSTTSNDEESFDAPPNGIHRNFQLGLKCRSPR